MNWIEILQAATSQPVMAIYMKALALVLFLGGWQHAASILGKGGQPWREMSLFLRSWDVILLIFNLVVGIGLILGKAWSVIGFLAGMALFQFIPYTVFQNRFATNEADRKTLRQLLGSEALMVAGLVTVFIIAV